MRSLPWTALHLGRKLKFHQLQVFDRVLETGSLVRAANETGLTQPAVSKIVHELEACFEGPLFVRSNRGMQPTELGELLGHRVKSLMAELRYLTDEVNAFSAGTSGHVIVGTLISASADLLPRTIAMLKSRAPGVLVTVREATTAQLFPALASGDLDIVVGRLPERALPVANAFALTHEVLFNESLCVVGATRHWEGAGERVPLAQLREGAWILPVPESPSRLAAERLFHDAGLPLPEDVVESLSVLTNIGLMLETARVALMPRAAATPFVESGLLRVLADTMPGSFGDVGYSLRSDKQPSPACERFVACLREACGLDPVKPR
ncbi:LysR family transcriptional regulator [Pandoraea nosoerga]|uniref:LysR family transcriptional regulator n=1 Tax=Pandoraea nosoerga TaxID=2508296 RepID=A0A5E4U2F3_9BURK|nr:MULTISPECIES: LysR substrate-binding domain-containing protein [Pandoraea]MBN4668105.1 LysR family transcriptional regulator [Pandoraea nosoerga]MBN4677948.1 LysR family transcriptional regulator [Pandoraea nosoerga]MBN4683132.1 LysR family transcriptional regulator [Pandoraea nosoerga]MBN4747098.1 LysR family transcriptional regulator [Pandoraea nosoerga]VVD94295.1 LysR family transcriptional regulator [Pandoraea nosoerga]